MNSQKQLDLNHLAQAFSVRDLNIKIFSDGADMDSILEAQRAGIVSGFTTNPTLMAKAGATHYMTFAREALRHVRDLPISFEVFSDEMDGMREQALILAGLAENVYVKIPVTNTRRESTAGLIRELAAQGIKLNVTAIMSLRQVAEVAQALSDETPSIISVFAGRIADSGRDPLPIMREAKQILAGHSRAELLWASPREVFNIVQAASIGCHIITVTPDLLAKTANLGRDLDEFSLDTVKMFYNDAVKSRFHIGQDERPGP